MWFNSTDKGYTRIGELIIMTDRKELLKLFEDRTGKTVVVPPIEQFKPRWFSPRTDEIDRRIV